MLAVSVLFPVETHNPLGLLELTAFSGSEASAPHMGTDCVDDSCVCDGEAVHYSRGQPGL